MKTDKELQGEIQDAINWEPITNKAEINISVENGIVTLAGTVDGSLKKLTAEKIVKEISEVKGINNKIEVKSDYTDIENPQSDKPENAPRVSGA